MEKIITLFKVSFFISSILLSSLYLTASQPQQPTKKATALTIAASGQVVRRGGATIADASAKGTAVAASVLPSDSRAPGEFAPVINQAAAGGAGAAANQQGWMASWLSMFGPSFSGSTAGAASSGIEEELYPQALQEPLQANRVRLQALYLLESQKRAHGVIYEAVQRECVATTKRMNALVRVTHDLPEEHAVVTSIKAAETNVKLWQEELMQNAGNMLQVYCMLHQRGDEYRNEIEQALRRGKASKGQFFPDQPRLSFAEFAAQAVATISGEKAASPASPASPRD